MKGSPVNPIIKALKRAFTDLILKDVVVVVGSGNDGVRYPSEVRSRSVGC